jgi:hypothetical protein
VIAQELDAAQAANGDAGIKEIYLAKDDGSGKAGDPATSFVTTDVPIYCVVQLDSALPVTVKMNLVAVAVGGVKAETRVVSTSYRTRDNEDRVNFSGRPAGQWVPGRYRVDIFIGDRQVLSREFAVQKATQAKPVSKPQNSKSDKSRYAGPLKKN